MTRLISASLTVALLATLASSAQAQRGSDSYRYEPAFDSRKFASAFPCWYDDSLEANDTQATATNVASFRSLPTLSSCPGNDDWFAVQLERGDVLQVAAQFAHAEGDIDIAITSPGATGESSASTSNDEFVRYVARDAGTHYVYVHLYTDYGVVEGNGYKLDIDIERAAPQVAAGHNHSCYLRNGELSCWGSDVPTPTSLFPLVKIATGYQSTCALDTNEDIHCAMAGNDYFGQAPAVKTVWGGFTAVSASTYTACGLTNHGVATCWGMTPGASWSATDAAYVGGEPPPAGPFTQISVGGGHVCALRLDGDVACWGSNGFGQAPDNVTGPFVAVDAGATGTCAIRSDRTLECWGESLGVAPAGSFKQVQVGSDDACALTFAGDTLCWGDNKYGGGTPQYPDEPHATLSMGGYHGCATIANGYLDCWGWNYSGQVEVPAPAYPPTLTATGIYAPDVSGFTPNFKLWSDNAAKQRFVWLPPGTKIDTSDMDDWRMPIGAKVWKEFAFGSTMVETRLIERYGYGPNDYTMIAYDWNDAQTEAMPVPLGVQLAYGTHDIPAVSACNACHDGRASKILGFSAVQLSHDGSGTTMASLIEDGRLTHPTANGYDVDAYQPPGTTELIGGGDTAADAIGYLHANCGHCHNDTSALSGYNFNLWLSVTDDTVADTGVFNTAVDQPMLTTAYGELRIDGGDASNSGIYYRMSNRGNAAQMPPIATKITDTDGMAVVAKWIDSLP